MGRRPKASEKLKTLLSLEGANPALKGNKSQLELPKNPTSVGHTPQLEIQANSISLSSSRKRAKKQRAVVRRSGRIQSSFRPARINISEPVIEEIISEEIISEGENENEPQVYQEEEFIEPTTECKISLEERIDVVLEAQKKDRETLKSPKGPEISLPSQGPSRTNLHYRSLYFESQKKIESLTEENHRLGKKLEYALGKLEVYEKGPPLLSETLNMLLISNMSKATEAAIKLTSQTIASGGVPSPDAVTAPNNLHRKRQKGTGNEN